jgi:hypothetical protein
LPPSPYSLLKALAGETSARKSEASRICRELKADATERLAIEMIEKNIRIFKENLRYFQDLYYDRRLTLELRKLEYSAYSN